MPSSTFATRRRFAGALCLGLLGGLVACADTAKLDPAQGMGAAPVVPQPKTSLIPTVRIAPAQGWPDGMMPTAMAGLAVTALARDLEHPRWV